MRYDRLSELDEMAPEDLLREFCRRDDVETAQRRMKGASVAAGLHQNQTFHILRVEVAQGQGHHSKTEY